jgi:hypothetical protein
MLINNAICITVTPIGAIVRTGECRFERDTCDWVNNTNERSAASWKLATVSRRPANLPDKTFGAPGKRYNNLLPSLTHAFTLFVFYNLR